MDLLESARRWVLYNLPYNHSDVDLVNYLVRLDVHNLLVAYHNWISRLVIPQPRRVHRSTAIRSAFITEVEQRALAKIERDIECGHDLTKYLSQDVWTAAQVPIPAERLNKRKDLDLLLIDWEIHHLHISHFMQPNGFVKRADKLLFAMFRDFDAFLIDVGPHGHWAEANFLRILREEFPQASGAHVLNGITGSSREIGDEDHKTLRGSGVGTFRVIDGRAIVGSGGITSAGTSIRATREADRVIEFLEVFTDRWACDPSLIRELWAANGFTLPEVPSFEFLIDQIGVGILEERTRGIFYML